MYMYWVGYGGVPFALYVTGLDGLMGNGINGN